jgi:3-phenylpropionate/trans-cinnamate dioxygenase ferredoxin subunit
MLVKLISIDELKDCEAKALVVNSDLEVVVIKVENNLYVLENCCSHEKFPLSEGEVDCQDKTIECAKHGSTFDLETGKALCLPATHPVKVFDPVIKENELYIEI